MADYERINKVIQNSRFHTLGHVSQSMYFDFPAVYLIYLPNKSEVLYIGRTNSLKNRMEEHIFGMGIGNFWSKVRRRQDLPQNIHDYKLKYVRIDKYRERCFKECELLGVYEPQLNFTR